MNYSKANSCPARLLNAKEMKKKRNEVEFRDVFKNIFVWLDI